MTLLARSVKTSTGLGCELGGLIADRRGDHDLTVGLKSALALMEGRCLAK
jgi:hypothetical protein